MDILAHRSVATLGHESRAIHDYPIREYPVPSGGVRFILPTDLRQPLDGHPLGSDLYTRAAGHYSRDPGHGPFVQPCHVVYYCLRGEMSLRSSAGARRLSPGDIAIHPPGASELTAASDGERLTFYWVAFSGKLSTTYTQFIDLSEHVISVGLHPELIAQFEMLCRLHDPQLVESTVDRLINGANLLKVLLTSIPVLVARKAGTKKNRIQLSRIHELMAQRLAEPLRLEDMARVANLSPYHFARQYKKLTGLAPMQHFIRLRLQHACRLLDTTALPIKQVAVDVGYPDAQYFSRSFCRTFGLSPHAYRSRTSRLDQRSRVTAAKSQIPDPQGVSQ